MSSLEEENENAISVITHFVYESKKQLYSENEKAFLLINFNFNYGSIFVGICFHMKVDRSFYIRT